MQLVPTPQLRTRNRCARIAARLQHLLYVSTPQRVLLPDRMASTLRSLRCGQHRRDSSNSEEGRTHMMREHRSLIVWPSVIAAGLLAAACTDQPKVSMAPNRPAFWVVPPPAECPTGKWTGGGRIDPASPNPQSGSNWDGTDEAVHPEYFADPNPPLPSMSGKFTFGFNVFLGQEVVNGQPTGNCIVTKGEIEVNGHDFTVSDRTGTFKVAWHVSIHDGADAYDGRPVYAAVFSDAHSNPNDPSGKGVCLVVGIPDMPPTPPTGPGYMTARLNPQHTFERTQLEVCDNDRGGSEGGRTPTGFHRDAMRWRSEHYGDTHLIYLTGGNIVEHGS